MRNRTACLTTRVLVPLTVFLTIAVGCHEKTQTPAAYTGPVLASGDLCVEEVECGQTGFVIFEEGRSTGRFPGTFAVARLVPSEADSFGPAPRKAWWVGTIKEEKATYWTSLFNTIPDIQDVVILDRLSIEWPDSDLEAVAAAAGRMNAGLCVIWGPGEAAPEHAALLGVVMNTHARQPVAFVRADAGPEDFQPRGADQLEGDLKHRDVDYLVARKFQRQVKDCVYELITRDSKPPATQPSPWRSATTPPPASPLGPVYIVPNRPSTW